SQTIEFAAIASPSAKRHATLTRGSSWRNVSSTQARPHSVAGSRATTCATAGVYRPMSSAVRSPSRRSSAIARLTTVAMSPGSLNEECTVPVADHAHEHRNRQHGVRPRREEGNAAGLCDLIRGRLDEPEHFLLIWPDQYPDVEEHDRAEPRPDADQERVARRGRPHPERECVDEEIHAHERDRAGEPGCDGAPAEPQEGPRRHVLADAGAARPALVFRGHGERRNLHEIEVIEHPDPDDAREHVQPHEEAHFIEPDVECDEPDHDGENHARGNGSLDGIQRVHAGPPPMEL